ncbi:hypothetical protein HDV63DRAFT_389470 [Trichoderma sp. SZMC 28014]
MASSSNVQWEVDVLRLRTSTIDQRIDKLYANGRMQVPVIALIEARDPATGKYHMLTEAELDTIKLVNYYNPETELASPWAYSSVENEYDHVIYQRNSSKHVRPSSTETADTYQQKRYWVSTTDLNTTQIAATILQPNQKTFISDQEHRVTIEVIPPIQLEVNDLKMEEETIWHDLPRNRTMIQSNYYVSSKVHTLRQNTLIGHHPGDTYPMLKFCFQRIGAYYIYYWPMGPERDRIVGVSSTNDTIRTNQKRNAMCITSVYISDAALEYKNWSGKFILCDRYGNETIFYAKARQIDEYHSIEIIIDTKEG